ncbi:MAG TPA: TIGR01777 family oxidoreductase [Anaerolineales bacterium]|nr:TIGR01777 family oxidoreductase [Anaerolineales bacterium]
MRVIITGGSGLIGRALTDRLLKDKHQVLVLTRNPDKTRGIPPAAHVVKWDGRTPVGWGDLVNGDTAIVNLAGTGISERRWTDARKRAIHDSRINAGIAVSQAVELASVKPAVVLQASAVGYYGVGRDEIITENSPAGNDFLADICKQWEASTAGIEALTRRVVLRTGVVLSTLGGALPMMAFPYQLMVGGPVGSGKQWLPWIHIEDQVRAIMWLIENTNARGAYNLTAPEPLTNSKFGSVLGKVIGKPSLLPAPSFALKALFGEMSTILLDGQRAVPRRLLDEGFQFKFNTAEQALRDLFSEKPIELNERKAAFDLGGTAGALRVQAVRKASAALAGGAVAAKKAGAESSAEKRARVKARRTVTRLTRKGLPVPAEILAQAAPKSGAAAPAVAEVAAPAVAVTSAAASTAKPASSTPTNATAEDKKAAVAARRAEALAKKKSSEG